MAMFGKGLLAKVGKRFGDEAASKGIIAYHGSPHAFDRFSVDSVGTGEGAQAFGHGLYFAGNEKVAKSYRDATAKGLSMNYNGQSLARAYLSDQGWDADKTIASLRNNLDNPTLNPKLHADNRAALEYIQKNGVPKRDGHMYEAHLDVNPDQLLDWDKPVAEQPPLIQDAASDLYKLPRKQMAREGQFLHPSGPDESQQLLERGVPGLQYFDRQSRGAGEGTRNYVMFDDKPISILRRYAVPGAIGAGAATAYGASQDQADAAPFFTGKGVRALFGLGAKAAEEAPRVIDPLAQQSWDRDTAALNAPGRFSAARGDNPTRMGAPLAGKFDGVDPKKLLSTALLGAGVAGAATAGGQGQSEAAPLNNAIEGALLRAPRGVYDALAGGGKFKSLAIKGGSVDLHIGSGARGLLPKEVSWDVGVEHDPAYWEQYRSANTREQMDALINANDANRSKLALPAFRAAEGAVKDDIASRPWWEPWTPASGYSFHPATPTHDKIYDGMIRRAAGDNPDYFVQKDADRNATYLRRKFPLRHEVAGAGAGAMLLWPDDAQGGQTGGDGGASPDVLRRDAGAVPQAVQGRRLLAANLLGNYRPVLDASPAPYMPGIKASDVLPYTLEHGPQDPRGGFQLGKPTTYENELIGQDAERHFGQEQRRASWAMSPAAILNSDHPTSYIKQRGIDPIDDRLAHAFMDRERDESSLFGIAKSIGAGIAKRPVSTAIDAASLFLTPDLTPLFAPKEIAEGIAGQVDNAGTQFARDRAARARMTGDELTPYDPSTETPLGSDAQPFPTDTSSYRYVNRALRLPVPVRIGADYSDWAYNPLPYRTGSTPALSQYPPLNDDALALALAQRRNRK